MEGSQPGRLANPTNDRQVLAAPVPGARRGSCLGRVLPGSWSWGGMAGWLGHALTQEGQALLSPWVTGSVSQSLVNDTNHLQVFEDMLGLRDGLGMNDLLK